MKRFLPKCDPCGIVTLHGNGTVKGTGTIGNNGFFSLSLSQTSVNIFTAYCTFHLVPVPVPVPFPCSVTKLLQKGFAHTSKFFATSHASSDKKHFSHTLGQEKERRRSLVHNQCQRPTFVSKIAGGNGDPDIQAVNGYGTHSGPLT